MLHGIPHPLPDDDGYHASDRTLARSLANQASARQSTWGARAPVRPILAWSPSGSPPSGSANPLSGRRLCGLARVAGLFAEYPRHLLDTLREPIETGSVWISRANATAQFPARALIVAAMNPCRCGWLGHPRRGCKCTPTELARYAARVSGPVLDRLDLQTELPARTSEELRRASLGEPSEVVRARVLVGRARRARRRGRAAHRRRHGPRRHVRARGSSCPARGAHDRGSRGRGLRQRASAGGGTSVSGVRGAALRDAVDERNNPRRLAERDASWLEASCPDRVSA